MTNNITTVNVQQITAPAPETLQQTGAFISQGATTLAAGSDALLTQLSDLTPLLLAPSPLASLSWSGGTATATVNGSAVGVSNSYNSTTGLVSLTVNGFGLVPGQLVYVTGLMGTGAYASAEGTFVAGPDTAGSVVTYYIAPGLTMTITDSDGHAYVGTDLTSGDTFFTTIAGATPAVYNGTFLATYASATTFTYALVSDGGTSPATGTITFTPRNQAELVAMATTYFAQGNSQGVYVLELGFGEPAAGVTALTAYITANPNSAYTDGAAGFFYSYLVPRNWDGVPSFLAMLADFESTTAQTYFFITTTQANYHDYTARMKCAVTLIEAPGVPPTEFSMAAPFYVSLSYQPSATNKVPPFAFSFLYGVTSWPTKGNSALFATLKAANVNIVGTGAQGGISTATLYYGTTMDGQQFTYWYSVDWIQINVQINNDNAVINGSNSRINPLYYNQAGINRLQKVAATTCANAVTFGLANGTVLQTALDGPAFGLALDSGTYAGKLVVNAIPFVNYLSENPGDYKTGEYDGFTVVYIDQTGFIHILFNIQVTDFVAA